MKVNSQLKYYVKDNEIYIMGMFDGSFKSVKTPNLPYAFIDAKHVDELKDMNGVITIRDEGYTDEFGNKVITFYCSEPKYVGEIRRIMDERGIKTYEADIIFVHRLIYDQQFEVEYTDDNIAFVDIEVSDEDGMPHNGNKPILSIALYDINGNAIWFYIGDYPNEEAMLKAFISYLKRHNKTIFTAWNVNFDYEYLMKRCEKLNVDTLYLSLMHAEDLLTYYKQVVKGLPSYKLEYVAEYEGIAPKIKRDKLISQMNRDELYEYNMRDAYIIWQIEVKKFLIRKLINMVNVFQLTMDMLNATILWDCLNCRRVRELNKVMMNKEPRGKHNKYEGALVIEPKVGLWENVLYLDVESLYPNVLMQKNIDIGNFNGEVMPILIRKYFELRRYYKKKRNEYPKGSPEYIYYDLLQNSYKIVINSGYGIFGAPWFRYYDPDKALAITSGGQEVLTKMISFIEEGLGLTVLYADSVTGDTKILVRENGKIRYVPIKELFRKVSHVDKRTGKEYYFHNEWETLTLDENGCVVWRPILYVMRHKTNKKIYRLWFNNTQYIDVTEDHGIFGYVNVVNRKYVECDNMGIVLVTPNEFGNFVKSLIMPKFAIPIHKNNSIAVKFWELIGLLVGDGNWGGNSNWAKYYLGLSTGLDTNEIIEKVLKPLKEAGIISNYYIKNEKGDITILSKRLAQLMMMFKDESGKKIIPIWLNDIPIEYIAAFLRGLFSADGTVIIRNQNITVRLTSIHLELLERAQELLLILGIPSVIFTERNGNKYKGKYTGTVSKHLYIKDVSGFRMSVGFILERKQQRLLLYRQSVKFLNIDKYDFTLQHVVKVEEIEYDDYVYDVEVEDTHRFFANGILVHNTDSALILLDGKDPSVVEDLVNIYIHPYRVKIEDVFVKFILIKSATGDKAAKKRYIGLKSDGNIMYKGIELRRGDAPEITKIIMEDVIKMILDGKSKSEIYDYLNEMYNRLRSGEFNEQLIISVGVKDDINDYKVMPPHVRAYEIAIRQGYPPVDNTIQFVYANGDVVPITPLTDINELVINYNHYWNMYVMRPVKRIISSVFNRQSSLDTYFNAQ